MYHWNAGERGLNARELLFPAALAIAWRLTAKPQYLAQLRRCLDYWLDWCVLQTSPRCTKNAAAFYRTWVDALAVLAETGHLTQAEYLPMSANPSHPHSHEMSR